MREIEIDESLCTKCNSVNTLCPHCKIEMDYRKVSGPNIPEDGHIWTCPDCPNVMFEFTDSNSLLLLKAYLNEIESIIEMIYFDTYAYTNIEGNEVRSVPFSVKWLDSFFQKEGITLEDFRDSYTYDDVIEMRNEYLYQMEEEITEGLSGSSKLYQEIKPL